MIDKKDALAPYFMGNPFSTLANLERALTKLGVRAKVRVFQESGLIRIRVSRDVEQLFRMWVEPRRIVGVQIFVVGDLLWWECFWRRVQI